MAMSRSFGGRLLTTRVADADLAAGDVLEPGDHAQQGRLPAAGRADQDDELAILDVDRHAVDDLRRPEGLADVPDLDARHVSFRPRPHRLACVSSRRPIGGSLQASSAEPRARSSRIFHCYAVILGRSRRRRPEDLRTVRRVRVMRSSGLASLARGRRFRKAPYAARGPRVSLRSPEDDVRGRSGPRARRRYACG